MAYTRRYPGGFLDRPATSTPADAQFLNAVESTLLSLSEPFAVKSFGAIGDNSHDDTANIQAAIDACIAAGGGVVYLNPGIYKITSPLLITADNVKFCGTHMGIPYNPSGGSWGASVLVPTGAAAFSGKGFLIAQQPVVTRSLIGIEISDFSVWCGNMPAGSHGIMGMLNSSVIRRVRLGNPRGYGFYLDGVATDGWNNNIELNFIQNPGAGGMYFSATGAPDIRVSRNTILSSGGYGINCQAPGLSIHDNFILDCALQAIFGNIYETKIWNNRIEDANGGIYLSGAVGYGGFSIVGNKIWNCSRDADNAMDSVNITATAVIHGGIISTNDFYTNEGLSNGGAFGFKNRPRYHVNIASANIHDVVLGPNSYKGFNNALSSFASAAYQDLGTGTRNFDALVP